MCKPQLDVKSKNVGLNIAHKRRCSCQFTLLQAVGLPTGNRIREEQRLACDDWSSDCGRVERLDEPRVDNIDPNQGTTFN